MISDFDAQGVSKVINQCFLIATRGNSLANVYQTHISTKLPHFATSIFSPLQLEIMGAKGPVHSQQLDPFFDLRALALYNGNQDNSSMV